MGIWSWFPDRNFPKAIKMMPWVMIILNFLTSFLLKPQERASFLIARIVGYFFLILALGFGIFFLFQALVPVIGHLESGAVLCVLLAGIGILFLFLSRKKRHRPIDDIMGEAQCIFKKVNLGVKNLEVDKILKENVPTILLCSFIAGLILSQVKDVRKLSLLKDKFLHVKDLLGWGD